MLKRATLISNISERFNGEAFLYEVDPPIKYGICDEPDGRGFIDSNETNFVIVSTLSRLSSIFPCDNYGKVSSWNEITSVITMASPEMMLGRLGYTIDKHITQETTNETRTARSK